MITAEKSEMNLSYKLYTVETLKDVNGNEVQVPKLIGNCSIEQLESQKNSYLAMIADIDEKLKAIASLQ